MQVMDVDKSNEQSLNAAQAIRCKGTPKSNKRMLVIGAVSALLLVAGGIAYGLSIPSPQPANVEGMGLCG